MVGGREQPTRPGNRSRRPFEPVPTVALERFHDFLFRPVVFLLPSADVIGLAIERERHPMTMRLDGIANRIDDVGRGEIVHTDRDAVVVVAIEELGQYAPAGLRADMQRQRHVIGDRIEIESRIRQVAFVGLHRGRRLQGLGLQLARE